MCTFFTEFSLLCNELKKSATSVTKISEKNPVY